MKFLQAQFIGRSHICPSQLPSNCFRDNAILQVHMILAFSTCFSVPQLYHFETLRVETLAYGGRWCAIIQKVFWVVQDTLEGVSKKTIRSPRHLDYICHKCNGLQRLHLSIFRSYAFNSFHQSFIVTHFFWGHLSTKIGAFLICHMFFSPVTFVTFRATATRRIGIQGMDF